MSRIEYEHCGLNRYGRQLVGGRQTVKEVLIWQYPDGHEERGERDISVPVAQIETMGSCDRCGLQLRRYTFPNGEAYEEFRQCITPCSDWVRVFLALRDSSGEVVPQSLWTEEDIKEYGSFGKCG